MTRTTKGTTTKAPRSPKGVRRRARNAKNASGAIVVSNAPVKSLQGCTGRDAVLAAIVRLYSVGFELDRLHTEACSGKRGTAWHQHEEIGRTLAEFDAAQDAAIGALGFTIDEVMFAYLELEKVA